MSESQDKLVKALKEINLERFVASAKPMGDGTQLNLQQRLEVALAIVPRNRWTTIFGRSEKQLRRYLDGADPPFSVITTISKMTGVAVDWITSGRPSQEGAQPVLPLSQGYSRNNIETRPNAVAEGGRQPINQVSEVERTSKDGKRLIMQTLRQVVPSLSGFEGISRGNATLSRHPDLIDHPQVTENLAFKSELLKDELHLKAEELLLVEVRGNWMAPLLPNGTIVIVNLAEQPLEDGAIYVLYIGNSLVVRRVESRLDGSLLLHSDNKQYSDERMDRSTFEQLVVGKVESWWVARKYVTPAFGGGLA